MILGIGTDIVYIPRIAKIWKKYGDKFLNKVFAKQEILDSYRYNSFIMKLNHFAKRFAAKEAYVKALGTGFGKKIKMTEIVTFNELSGKPNIIITNPTFIAEKNYNILLSITDEKKYAIAMVIIEK